jgi:hypothetical protein
MQELLVQARPLYCPVWLSSQMWILQFDEEFFSLSRKIWNRYGMALRTGVLSLDDEKRYRNIYHHMRSPNTGIFDMSVKATCAILEIQPDSAEEVFDDLLRFYHTEMIHVKQLNLQALQETGDANNFEGNKRFNRIALPQIVERCAHLVPTDSIKKLLEFFITTGSVDSDSAVARQSLKAAEALIRARGSGYAGKLLAILEKFVDDAEQYQTESVHQAVLLIGTLSDYLDKAMQKKLLATFEKMQALLMRPAEKRSELVNKSVCRCVPKLARFFEDKAK